MSLKPFCRFVFFSFRLNIIFDTLRIRYEYSPRRCSDSRKRMTKCFFRSAVVQYLAPISEDQKNIFRLSASSVDCEIYVTANIRRCCRLNSHVLSTENIAIHPRGIAECCIYGECIFVIYIVSYFYFCYYFHPNAVV